MDRLAPCRCQAGGKAESGIVLSFLQLIELFHKTSGLSPYRGYARVSREPLEHVQGFLLCLSSPVLDSSRLALGMSWIVGVGFVDRLVVPHYIIIPRVEAYICAHFLSN